MSKTKPIISKEDRLIDILRVVHGTILGLGPWSLLWIAMYSAPAEILYIFGYPMVYVGMIESMICLIFAVVYVRKTIPLTFVAISLGVPPYLLHYIDKNILDKRWYSNYPLGFLLFALILIPLYLLFVSFEYLLTQRSDRVIARKWYHWTGIVIAIILGVSTLIPIPLGKYSLLGYYAHCPFAPVSTILCWSVAVLVHWLGRKKKNLS